MNSLRFWTLYSTGTRTCWRLQVDGQLIKANSFIFFYRVFCLHVSRISPSGAFNTRHNLLVHVPFDVVCWSYNITLPANGSPVFVNAINVHVPKKSAQLRFFIVFNCNSTKSLYIIVEIFVSLVINGYKVSVEFLNRLLVH